MSVARSTASERRSDPAARGRGGVAAQALKAIDGLAAEAREHLAWLEASFPALFDSTLRDDREVVAGLATALPRVRSDRQVTLVDREAELVLASLDTPGSIFETLRRLRDREITFAEMFHSDAPVPGTERRLEVQRYDFAAATTAATATANAAAPEPAPEPLPDAIRKAVRSALRAGGVEDDRETERLLGDLWADAPRFVRLAPAARVARFLWLLRQGELEGGVCLHVANPDEAAAARGEKLVLFAVENPPQKEFLAQLIEVMNALDIGVRRSAVLQVRAGGHPWCLAAFQVAHRKGESLESGSPLLGRLRSQLFNTQVLATDNDTYREMVLPGVMTGVEASLVVAFIGFCHTNCAHNQPTRYTFEDVVRAFHSHPDIALRLVRLFEARFDPDRPDRSVYERLLRDMEQEVADYNTGHRMLDEFRRSLFRTALVFVRRTLKTNYFVEAKGALAFRLEAAYLDDLGPDFTADLPAERPFRVTFFSGRNALGYHIGFSDIARGGWRTIVTQNRDDYVTVANTVFRENYVLAHTQHLKNKDIYEGGSKMVVVLRAQDVRSRDRLDERLHKVQWGIIGAFFDIFVTEKGVARDPRVVDHYREDEPIELGPDENMHDSMIERVAALSTRRGYVLGAGVMSSKKVGINHKQYGVTSTGVVAFAEAAMREQGVDLARDRFDVKITGGPNGDVAGNALRILLERCPEVRIRLVLDGTAALVDPAGLDRQALSRIVLRADADAFDVSRLSPGGFALYRNVRRTEGLRELYRRVEMTASGAHESWVTVDEFHKEFDALLFTVPADLFIPAGGRPETIDGRNWKRYLGPDGKPSARVVVEGANSFITPEARARLQEAGAVVLRDASANKCGVISSSYEIIGNLLLADLEFLANKEEYVKDVLAILVRRATDEAALILRRHREEGGKRSYTDISDALSREINGHKARLFRFFEEHPEAWKKGVYRRALLAHLPALVRENAKFRGRVKDLPSKYRSAILAAELATTMTYRAPLEPDFAAELEGWAGRMYADGGGMVLFTIAMTFAGTFGVPRRHYDISFSGAAL
ncbi:MAG TPA: NAD-glutamate dehydrogenase domain-containing protein, partial [Anaeromyxobacteraceae bacterium]|nr:NAD-glutamate dehydrogenase domain-containing protein [Anaeromyxobacteraceae bacterium]